MGGSNSPEGEGPFPTDGLVPPLAPLSDYGWLVGLLSAMLVHWALGRFLPDPGQRAAEEEAAGRPRLLNPRRVPGRRAVVPPRGALFVPGFRTADVGEQ
ncbi:hypothetical protein GCM10007079_00710 [Nocardiopsis terrae]|uniref:Uncharacterized protein n=1 Tax=Nocardiopsis terrae TaxID=372655 RepID=A0ABR9HME1_9ACTN|nr:hypothetical protein [Nocardiopsis terrae]GHC69817.1 hypothetical protein GCM10007079_00710 [Nocardiopsis terrae]